MQTSYWLILFVILLIIEILTMGLTTIWFAGGALAAFLAGMLGLGLPVQIGISPSTIPWTQSVASPMLWRL